MISAFIILVPFAFAAIHFLEFSAILARVAGIRKASHLVGYSIQQAVYVGTRMFIVSLLPMLGFLVDMRIPSDTYVAVTLCALALAALFSLLALQMRERIVRYYASVIGRYKNGRSFVSSLFGRSFGDHDGNRLHSERILSIVETPDALRIAFGACMVFAIYSTGIFISFYFALLHFEHRASISQLSGLVNSVGTVLLTFYVEPQISRGIDEKREDAENRAYR
ncbi:lipid II flippase family protein [Jhaorihella thermophila]|uniref:Uncharacterized protein n=1 Tax=Jhaorihella thermophila TaxID=488547 RepID=A0A1H5YKN2_9RHOB|nr:Protein of unknown function [Jhaorihella thermophila]